MRTVVAKRFILIAVLGVSVFAAAVLLLGLGQLTERTGSGADPASAFSEIPLVPEQLSELVTWGPDPTLDRPVEPDTRRFVESAWVRGWAGVDAAQRSGDRSEVTARFVGPLVDQVAQTARPSAPAALTQHGHELEVVFYSLDGSVMALSATSEIERQLLGGPSLRSTEQYQVVMLLSDGNWRIQHLVRQ